MWSFIVEKYVEPGINRLILSNLHKNISCGYSFEVPWRGAFNEFPQFYGELKKNHSINTRNPA